MYMSNLFQVQIHSIHKSMARWEAMMGGLIRYGKIRDFAKEMMILTEECVWGKEGGREESVTSCWY